LLERVLALALLMFALVWAASSLGGGGDEALPPEPPPCMGCEEEPFSPGPATLPPGEPAPTPEPQPAPEPPPAPERSPGLVGGLLGSPP